MFTQEEALAVTLGLAGIHWLQVALPALAVDGALAKVYRALPAHLRERAQTLSRHLSVDHQLSDEIPSLSLLVTLSEAIEARSNLLVGYRSRTEATTERQVSPYGVVGWAGHWYLVGHCQLRQALRVFRLDRLQTVEVLSSSFARPEQMDCLAVVMESVATMPGAWLIEVEFQATLEAVQHKVSATSHHLEPGEAGVLYRCHFDDLEEFARYLVGLGLPFVVRRPPALALVLQQLAAALLRAATPSSG
jgi:predicted DNA-binding transcriptional regulator YafY